MVDGITVVIVVRFAGCLKLVYVLIERKVERQNRFIFFSFSLIFGDHLNFFG
jgi:hypothetical protein